MLQKLKLKVVIMLTESCSNGDYISNGYIGEIAPGLQVTFIIYIFVTVDISNKHDVQMKRSYYSLVSKHLNL